MRWSGLICRYGCLRARRSFLPGRLFFLMRPAGFLLAFSAAFAARFGGQFDAGFLWAAGAGDEAEI